MRLIRYHSLSAHAVLFVMFVCCFMSLANSLGHIERVSYPNNNVPECTLPKHSAFSCFTIKQQVLF